MDAKETAKCQLCGEPMPRGEEMFTYHGFSGPCPKPPLPKVVPAIELIKTERERQVSVEGWTPEHDDTHTSEELALAAMMYATPGGVRDVDAWPFSSESWKPTPNDRVRELVKAGALIAAEIDRLQRAEARTT